MIMKKVVTLSLDDDTIARLDQLADKLNMSKSEFVREAISYFASVDAAGLLRDAPAVPSSRLKVER